METQPTPTPKRTTAAGTPCSPRWSESWIALVDATETTVNHRICGATTDDGFPCMLESKHPNGRCRFHGGNLMVGAKPCNQNAGVHGLYQRRLQTCGPHCAYWDTCAYSGDDILALDPGQRPKCAYEQAEYEALLQDFFNYNLEDVANPEAPDAPPTRDPYDAHQLVMLQIMMTRAAAALEQGQISETVANAHGQSTKVSAAFEAFIRTAREYRQLRTTGKKRDGGAVEKPDLGQKSEQKTGTDASERSETGLSRAFCDAAKSVTPYSTALLSTDCTF